MTEQTCQGSHAAGALCNRQPITASQFRQTACQLWVNGSFFLYSCIPVFLYSIISGFSFQSQAYNTWFFWFSSGWEKPVMSHGTSGYDFWWIFGQATHSNQSAFLRKSSQIGTLGQVPVGHPPSQGFGPSGSVLAHAATRRGWETRQQTQETKEPGQRQDKKPKKEASDSSVSGDEGNQDHSHPGRGDVRAGANEDLLLTSTNWLKQVCFSHWLMGMLFLCQYVRSISPWVTVPTSCLFIDGVISTLELDTHVGQWRKFWFSKGGKWCSLNYMEWGPVWEILSSYWWVSRPPGSFTTPVLDLWNKFDCPGCVEWQRGRVAWGQDAW